MSSSSRPFLLLASALVLLSAAVAQAASGAESKLGLAPFATARPGDSVEYRIAATDASRASIGNNRFEVKSVTETVLIAGTDPEGNLVGTFSVRRDETDPREIVQAFGMAVPATATLTVDPHASVSLDDRECPAEMVHAAWSTGDDDFDVAFFFTPEVPVAGLGLVRSLSRERGEAVWSRLTVVVPVAMRRAPDGAGRR